MLVDVSLPEGWFLCSLKDKRTSVCYLGDKHEHLSWEAEAQWVNGGGRLTVGAGPTPQEAMQNLRDILNVNAAKGRDDE